MLARVGVAQIDDLFAAIPEPYRLSSALDLEPALDEPRLMQHLTALAQASTGASMLSFLGGGMYRHHVPPAVDQLLQRSEFYTAYTPYQAELSQGTLQAIFEFQTIVCELFGTDVANASMYDGASGAAEAVLMARRIKRRSHLLLSDALHPEYIETIRSYVQGLDTETTITLAPIAADGRTDWDAAKGLITDKTAAVVVGYPNFFGCVEDLDAARALADSHKALLVTATAEPYALSVLRPPGACGADICVGEVIEAFEGNMHLLECVATEDVCAIQSFCKLKGALAEAERVQLEYLNGVTLADVAPKKRQFSRIGSPHS